MEPKARSRGRLSYLVGCLIGWSTILVAACAPTPPPTLLPMTPQALIASTMTQAPSETPTSTNTPVPTDTSTLAAIATATATSTPVAVINTDKTIVYSGPANIGFDNVALLPKGAEVTPVGVFGQFVKVQVEVGFTTQDCFVLASALENVPPGLPTLTKDQVPWLSVSNYPNDLKLSSNDTSWKKDPQGNTSIRGDAEVDFTMAGSGPYWMILSDASNPGNALFVGFDASVEVKVNDISISHGTLLINSGKVFDGQIEVQVHENGKSITISSPTNNFQDFQLDLTTLDPVFANGIFAKGMVPQTLVSPGSKIDVSGLKVSQAPSGEAINATPTPKPRPTSHATSTSVSPQVVNGDVIMGTQNGVEFNLLAGQMPPWGYKGYYLDRDRAGSGSIVVNGRSFAFAYAPVVGDLVFARFENYPGEYAEKQFCSKGGGCAINFENAYVVQVKNVLGIRYFSANNPNPLVTPPSGGSSPYLWAEVIGLGSNGNIKVTQIYINLDTPLFVGATVTKDGHNFGHDGPGSGFTIATTRINSRLIAPGNFIGLAGQTDIPAGIVDNNGIVIIY
jgi:hypothetical protein